MPPLPADFIHARACKLKCEKILTRPELLIVKANVDRILQNTERGGNAQEKGTVSFAANCALY